MTNPNTAAVQRFLEDVVGRQDLAHLEELVAPDVSFEGPGADTMGTGRAALMAAIQDEFGDTEIVVMDLVADGDAVGARFAGTRSGANGTRPLRGLGVYHLDAGRIISVFTGTRDDEEWVN